MKDLLIVVTFTLMFYLVLQVIDELVQLKVYGFFLPKELRGVVSRSIIFSQISSNMLVPTYTNGPVWFVAIHDGGLSKYHVTFRDGKNYSIPKYYIWIYV